jgi:hypothetical protein
MESIYNGTNKPSYYQFEPTASLSLGGATRALREDSLIFHIGSAVDDGSRGDPHCRNDSWAADCGGGFGATGAETRGRLL